MYDVYACTFRTTNELMLSTHVPSKVTKLTKLHLASFTFIRFLVRVTTHVPLQSTRFTKSFIAHITLVRSLVRVRTHVAFQITRLTKTFLAHITFIRFLVRVNTHVDFQITKLTKSFIADIALVRFLVRVKSDALFLKRRTLFGQSREDLLNPNFYHWKQNHLLSSSLHFSFLSKLHIRGEYERKRSEE